MQSEEFAAVALSRVSGIGPKLFRQLVERFGSAGAALDSRPGELVSAAGVPAPTAARFTRSAHLREAERICRYCEREGVDIFRIGESNYPGGLRGYDIAPPVLYHFGPTDFSTSRIVAVVGTRRMSEEGARQVERLIDPLTAYDPLIVSGLAYGVDGAAHRRSLAVGLPTLAVMGSGLDHIYPYGHRLLARQISAGRGGCSRSIPTGSPPSGNTSRPVIAS